MSFFSKSLRKHLRPCVLLTAFIGLCCPPWSFAQAQTAPAKPAPTKTAASKAKASALPRQAANASVIVITDDLGKTVRLKQPAKRVVSLLPSLTEIVCALDACDRLVGVDQHSDWPAQVKRLPQLGSGLTPNIEAIVALRPDVVFTSNSPQMRERLTALGITVVAFRTQNYADIQNGMIRTAALLGAPESKAKSAWSTIEKGIAHAAKSIPPKARGKRVFVEVSRGPFAAGVGSFIGETLQAMGMQNAVPAEQGPFPQLNPEFVLRSNPDLLVFAHQAAKDNRLYPGWNHMPAVKQKRICRLNPQEINLLVRPGPRMAEGAAVLAKCIRQKGL